jgi:translation initiation factor IF-3
VVGPNGEDLGLMTVAEAMEKAQKVDLDLIELDPRADPIVFQILDYGKAKYEEQLQLRRVAQEARAILREGRPPIRRPQKWDRKNRDRERR